MDYLSIIRGPVEGDMERFTELFSRSLQHEDGLLGQALEHIRKRMGKRMRPMLILLMARNFGQVTDVTLHAAVGLELLHTASLVHDDVVDESGERRGQASVNAMYDNKAAVLVGDYLLSTALLNVAFTRNETIVRYLAELGRTLSDGELLQLSNIRSREISEEGYFDVIRRKTAALFEACAAIGSLSAGAADGDVERAKLFGQRLGIIFQIRDDIFDYYDSPDIGKPTGNDMAEGKLTLPAIHAVNNSRHESIRKLAYKVKDGTINQDEIAVLVEYTKTHGGIEYAERRMAGIHADCERYILENVNDGAIRRSLQAYLDYVAVRTK